MLALTPNAAQAVEAIVAQPDAPEGAVLRITSEPSVEGSEPIRDLRLAVVDAPEEDDLQVQGLALAVEPDTADFLEDKVLDADISAGNVQFSLYAQAPDMALPAEDEADEDEAARAEDAAQARQNGRPER